MAWRRESTNREEKTLFLPLPFPSTEWETASAQQGHGCPRSQRSVPGPGPGGEDGVRCPWPAAGWKTGGAREPNPEPQKRPAIRCSRGGSAWIKSRVPFMGPVCTYTLFLFFFLFLTVWQMKYSEMPWSGRRGALTKSSKMITAEAEASEKFPKGAIKTIFPKIFKAAWRKAPENLMGKILERRAFRYPAPWPGAPVPPCCGGRFPKPVAQPGTPWALVPGWHLLVALALQQVLGQESAEFWGWGLNSADRRRVRESARAPSHLLWGRRPAESKRKLERWI